MPSGYRCQYLTDWVATEMRWALSLDTDEKAAITDVLDNCPDVPLTVTPAR
ncbi:MULTISPECIES: hypothetical protein [Streptomyces]|uniref:Uncharacterized protein n=1 Tax=Streptomyces canarius TaxID=285453 RepID=A0ABQ3DA72_9ACTN|nr:hypothetical protein [Streptomyces canarius]GHA68144.1 hypothetical protein GCM10010345_84770 [Streptomyces canarius]